jgi:peptidoglycan/LPS O-acetylase OafA/YrhL
VVVTRAAELPDSPAGSPAGASSATAGTAGCQPAEEARIVALDGLRAVALVLVMVYHVNRLFPAPPPGAPWLDRLVAGAAQVGWCGVDLFFVLSGFLITQLLRSSRGSRGYFSAFYGRRALRILPAYYGFLVVLVLAAPLLGPRDEAAVLRAHQPWYWAFLVNVLVMRDGWSGTPLHSGHLWSLAIEAHFYLLWPLVVWHFDRRRLWTWCIATFAISAAGRIALHVLHVAPEVGYVCSLTHLEGLAAGSLLALALESKGRDGLSVPALVAAVGAGVCGILLLAATRGTLRPTDPIGVLVAIPCAAVAGAGVVGLASAPNGMLARVLSHPLLATAGHYSYAAYLFHDPVALLVLRSRLVETSATPPETSTLPARALFLLIVAALTGLAAVLSWVLIEKRALALKRRWPRAGQPPPRPAASELQALD